MASLIKKPSTDSSGQNAAQLAEQAGLDAAGSQKTIMSQMAQGVNPDAAVGSAVMDANKANPETQSNPEPQAGSKTTPIAETSAVTNSTADIKTEEDKTKAGIDTATAKLSEQTQSAYDKAFGMLDAMAAAAKTDREQSIANIQREAEISKQDTAVSQRMETGSISQRMASMGGYLGNSGSSVAYMQSLAQTHRLEVTKLEAAWAAAVEKAKAAYDEKDMKLAQQLMETANGYQNQIEAKRINDSNLAIQAQTMAKFDRETITDTLESWAAQDFRMEDIPPERFDGMDKDGGWKSGTAKGLYQIAVNERKLKDEQDVAAKQKSYLENQKALVDLLSNISFKEKITIDGIEYHGTKSDTTFSGYEIDPATGNIALVNIDNLTGKATVSVQKGVLTPNIEYTIETGSDGKQWHIPNNPTQGTAVPVMVPQAGAGINTEVLLNSYPAGQKPDGTTYGWCLEFARSISDDLDGYPVGSLDTIEAKRGIAEPGLNVNNITAGSWILTNEDSKWGHIALITDVRIDPTTGKKVAVLTESNGPGSAGVINHSRTIVLDESNMEQNGGKIMGFKKADLVEQLTSQNTTKQLEAYEKPKAGAEAGGTITFTDPIEDWTSRRLMDAGKTLDDKKRTPEDFQFALEQTQRTGDPTWVQEEIKSKVLSGSFAAGENAIIGRNATINALENAKKKLDDMVANNKDTGLITGKFEDILNKLGETGDPTLRELAAYISPAQMDYRRTQTGVAFSEKEQQTYDKLFPNTKQSPALFAANVQALIQSMKDSNEALIKTKIGEKAYDRYFGSGATSGKSTPPSDNVFNSSSGNTYDFSGL